MKDSRLQKLRSAGWVVFGLILASVLVFGIVTLFSGGGAPQRRVVTTVTRVLLPPPPPPPPPPPKPPEPVKEDKPVEKPKIEEPKQALKSPPKEPAKPNLPAAPPGAPLTAEAGAGANPYGLGVGSGGGDVIGGSGGGGGARWAAYASAIQAQVQAALGRDEKLRFAAFRAPIKIWFKPGGEVTRAQVTASSGDPSIDQAIERDVVGVQLADLPPDMPQPVSLRVQFSHR